MNQSCGHQWEEHARETELSAHLVSPTSRNLFGDPACARHGVNGDVNEQRLGGDVVGIEHSALTKSQQKS